MAFECGVCTSMYNNGVRIPLLLECGHTFCQSCVQHNLGPQRCCPYCRHPIQKHVDDLPRNYALENAMEAANLPLVELMDRWGLANAERMMVKPDHLTLDSLMSRKGYTGEVWNGTLWGKPVAVKLLPLLDVDERQLECLRREVAVLLHTTGECKQVCIYKGFCVKNGNFAIIMKLYSYSLANRVSHAPGRRLPLPLALKYSIDVVKGLVELHRLGVIAADLKPDNVLIDEELGDAVIADFGISSVVTTTIGNTGRGSALRSSGAMRGTPNYMAPEQFAPGCRTTNKVDIWGFAATLLHMVTGSPPWQHDTLMQICTAVGVAKQAPPLPEGLPGPLQALMGTCFDADPARRPTAVYLLKALQAMGPVLQQHMMVGPGSSKAPAQQQQQQQQLPAPHASKISGATVDDKQAGLDQYLAQLGLSGPHSRLHTVSSGGGGMPSAPPMPRNSGSGGSSYPSAHADCLGRRSSSAGGSSSRQKLPRVLWTEDEALQEQHQVAQQHQQQPRQQASSAAPGCLGAMQANVAGISQQQKPHWAPHHMRSASEQVSGLSSRAYQQQQLQQQLVQPQEVAGGAHMQPQQQPYHARSRSEVVPGWGASALDAAANAGFLSSRAPRGADGSALPTHYESASPADSAGISPDPKLSATAAVPGLKEDLGAAGAGQVKRQRQQWNIPAQQQQQQQACTTGVFDVPACAAAADDATAYGNFPTGYPSTGEDATSAAAAAGQDPKQQWHGQQQHLAVSSMAANAQQQQQPQQPWWETPFDASRARSPSPEAAPGKVPLPTTAALAGSGSHHGLQDQAGVYTAPGKQGPPPPLLVHAHAEDIAAPVPVSSRNGGSSSSASSNASMSRAASIDNSFTGREGAGPSASVCSRPGSARRPARTLGNLLLGRAGSRAALPCELAASDSASSASSAVAVVAGAAGSSGSGSGVSYPPSLAKIRMAFGPASPERVPRGGAWGSNGNLAGSSPSILSAAACAAAGGAAVGAGAAAAALCTGTSVAAAAGAGAGMVVLAGGTAAAAAASIPAAAAVAAVGAVGSAGVVAAMASRFSKGPKNGKGKSGSPGAASPSRPSSVPASPASVADQHCTAVSSAPEKPSRWRALFGSPSRSRPSPQSSMSDRGCSSRRCSVLDTTGVHAVSSSAADAPMSCSSSPAGYMQQSAAAAGPMLHGLDSPSSVRPVSPTKQGLAVAAAVHDSGELHKVPLTPQSAAAAHAANIAAAEAARASGTCSPLKAHARNLSLPSKLMVMGSADNSPASSPNPVASGSSSPAHSQRQQQQHDAAASGRPASPSRLGSSSRHSSSGGAAPAAVEAASGSSSSSSGSGGAVSSHSQLLAEAMQLEALARTLSSSGRHEEAEAALRNSLAMISKQLGPGHPNTVAATTRLALHLNRNSKHTEAERLLRQVLTHKQATLGRKHLQVAAASINLAACLYSQGHYNAAARLYSTTLEIRKASLGDTHADTASCLNNLALCYSRLSDWPQAEQLFRDALSARVAALGQLHPDVAITAHQLGHCLGQLGQHTEALVYHKQGLWVRQQQEHRGPQQQDPASSSSDGSSGARGSSSGGSSGNPAEDLVASHRCVALCLARLGCDSQAQEHLTHVLLVRSSQVTALKPPPPPGAGAAGGTLGGRSSRTPSTVGAGGKLDDVDWGVLAEGDSRLSKQQADGLLALASASEELGRCLSRQGKHADAEEQYWKALEARSQVLGSRHDLVMATEEVLRNCLEQQC